MGAPVQKRELRNKLMIRFVRSYPGENVVLRSQNESLAKRTVHFVQKARIVASETANLHTFGSKPMGVRVDASPNAPLLKRLVLHPFALAVGYPKRIPIEGLGASSKRRVRTRTVCASELTRTGRSKISAPNPVAAIADARRMERIRPSAEAWLQKSGAE